ncbi:MAG: hypothetical protein U0V04_15440 [Spirosomataceae bacterium]|jgi:transcriptional antiterminator Rof (Rho-off)
MRKTTGILFLFMVLASITMAQKKEKYPAFIPSFNSFSHKKISYVTLKDGTKIEGEIDDLDRKKGLIEEIEIKPTGAKKKMTIDPVQLQDAYLTPSALSKMATINSELGRIQKISKYDVNKDLVEKGYVYFESSLTQIKKKEDYVILQLLNPTFTGRIRVFDDPMAQESASVGFGGLTLAGGDSKSYYIKKDDQKAYRLKRADFKEDFPKLFGDCPAVLKAIEGEAKWLDLNKYVYIYNDSCSK